MEKLFLAINHCHSRLVAHRDIKPENILYSQNKKDIKIIDFGLAKHLSPKATMTTKVGTPYYVAPDVLDGSYDLRCDLWTVGVIAYTLIVGYPPFLAVTHAEIFQKINRCDFDFPQKLES